MKKKAIALALSLALMLSIFVPGTFAMGTQSEDQTTAVSEQTAVPQNGGDQQKTEDGTVKDGNAANPSVPGESVDPSDPSVPDESVDPSDPSVPDESVDPSDPSVPDESVDPSDPGVPDESVEPSKPAETTAPAEATNPTEPADVMPQLMMLIEQDMLAGGSEKIDPKWFEFDGVTMPEDFTGVQEGPITADKVPPIPGYTFAGAFVNEIAVKNIGQITYNETTYVYYTTEGSSDVAALILEGGMKITLQYKLNPVPINYSVTVDGEDSPNLTANGVPYGGDQRVDVKVIPDSNPKEEFPGDKYTFTVEIPRGYVATVSVNGVEQTQQLGVSPNYYPDGNTIETNGPKTQYQALYTVPADTENNVNVALTKKDDYTFSHELMSTIIYFAGRANYTVNGTNGLSGPVKPDGTLVWEIITNPDWWLNKLEINDVKISVPLENDQVVETVMPSGTVVRISRTGNWSSYTYTINFSNCYENLVVTSGNLNAKNHQEYMPTTYTGIAQAQYKKDGVWHDMYIGQPVSRGDLETKSEQVWGPFDMSGKRTYTAQFRFKLLPGYGDPMLKLNDKSIDTQLIDGWYQTDSTTVVTQEKYITWQEEDYCGFDGYTRFIHIVAQPIDVTVTYQAGGEVSGVENLPTDSNAYNLTNNNQVLIPLAIPKDHTNQMVFTGWENGGKNYLPNQLVPLSELSIENGKAVFTAQWVNVENAKQINFTIQIKDGDTLLDEITSSAPKNVPIILDLQSKSIQDWLAAHPEYEIADDNQLYYQSIENNQDVVLKVVEKTVTIHYDVVGPDGCGAVAPAAETVKVKSGTPSGSVPTPNSGFRFVGWFTDEDCTIPANGVSGDNRLTPQKTGSLWTEATYYAKFEHATADLTIFANGLDGTYETQGTIYKVTVDADDGKSDKTFYVSINGNNSTTIYDLPYGKYTVEPMNSWSWRYSAASQGSVTPEANDDGEMAASVTLTFSGLSTKWLSGNSYATCGSK